MRKMRPQLTSSDYFVFLQESLSKVLTNQNMFSKQNKTSALHQGWQWAFKSKGFFS